MKLFTTSLLLLLNFYIQAQIDLPRLSPLQKIEQTVGLSQITVEYSRPYTKGRKIFGGLEAFGKVWRTGANRSTKVTFSDDIIFGDSLVTAGTYSLLTKPNKESWKIYLYPELQHWGVPADFSMNKVTASTSVPTGKTLAFVEQLTISLENITPFQCEMIISWENTSVAVPIKVTTDKIIGAKIEEKLAGPDFGDYYLAAKFKLISNQDLEQGLEWINKSIELSSDDPQFWTYQLQAEIYYAMGEKKKAVLIGEKALSMAKVEESKFFTKQIEDLLKSWK